MHDGYRVTTSDGVVFEKNQCVTGGGAKLSGAMKD